MTNGNLLSNNKIQRSNICRPYQHECSCTHTASTSPVAVSIHQTHEPFYQRPDFATTTSSSNYQRDLSNNESRSTSSTAEAKDHYSASNSNINDTSKVNEILSEEEGPPLPPRPPLRPRSTFNYHERPPSHAPGVRKYVIWCLLCGGTSLIVGLMFLAVYFTLRSHTTTVAYFETIPTFVPATLLILTGICIMSLARRRNRYSYLIKLSGAFGVTSALMCALVTITTTVIHMSRLQSLRECEYQIKTRTCTCYTYTHEDFEFNRSTEEPSIRFVFDSTADCDVVHGALYSCLRTIFGLSVVGVLIAVFSCMLVYQLLSHERKKMYWEQLELRCRSLYTAQTPPSTSIATVGPLIETGRPDCRCCEQCHAHRQITSQIHSWDTENRFWIPGQAGNFYSPNPGDDFINNRVRGRRDPGGWSWRLPWQRNDRFRDTPSSPDSQYGFASNISDQLHSMQSNYRLVNASYGIWGPPPPYSDPNSPARRGRTYQYVANSVPNQPNAATTTVPSTIPELNQQTLQHQSFRVKRPNPKKSLNKESISGDDSSIKKASNKSSFKTADNRLKTSRLSNTQDVVYEESTENNSLQAVQEKQQKKNDAEVAESEVYFADVSSCCNISERNDNHYYEDRTGPISSQSGIQELLNTNDIDGYLSRRLCERDLSTRSRLPIPQAVDYQELTNQLAGAIPKNVSCQSVCSYESGEKTDLTDLSPATPSTSYNKPINVHQFVDGNSLNEIQSQKAMTKKISTRSHHDFYRGDKSWDMMEPAFSTQPDPFNSQTSTNTPKHINNSGRF